LNGRIEVNSESDHIGFVSFSVHCRNSESDFPANMLK